MNQIQQRVSGRLVQAHGRSIPQAGTGDRALLEALLVMVLLLGILWFVIYPLGFVAGGLLLRVASEFSIAALIAIALFISPRFRKESRQSRGLGSPVQFWRLLTRGRMLARLWFVIFAALLTSALTYELYHFTTGASRFVLGIGPDFVLKAPNTLGGKYLVLLLCLLISSVWTSCFVRWDNLWPTLKVGGRLLALTLPMVFGLGLLLNGLQPIRHADGRRLLDMCFGYCFWAALQQWLFCGYFVSRFCEAFEINREGAPLFSKRMFVSFLGGCFFGLIHLDNWAFMVLACVLGTLLSWLFTDKRYQNLQALGVVHGILGTCVIWLFCTPGARFHIALRVGPWQQGPGPDWVALSLTAAVILLLCGWAVACRLRSSPTSSGPLNIRRDEESCRECSSLPALSRQRELPL